MVNMKLIINLLMVYLENYNFVEGETYHEYIQTTDNIKHGIR